MDMEKWHTVMVQYMKDIGIMVDKKGKDLCKTDQEENKTQCGETGLFWIKYEYDIWNDKRL